MKKVLSPIEVMAELTSYMIDAYSTHEPKIEGAIQFLLEHKGEKTECYLKTDLVEMVFSEGIIENPTVTLQSSLYDWLDLSANRLNPAIGVMKKKLKFIGDTSFFSKVIPETMYDVDVSEYKDPVTDFEREPHKNWQKPSKVLVINASPRGKHGYTYFYLQAFIKGLESAGSEIDTININKSDIKPCRGCWHCWLLGTGECVVKDDTEMIYEKLQEADLVVYAFPLYADGVPGILKNLIERGTKTMHPYMIEGLRKIRHPRRKVKNQAAVLFSICGFPEMDHFDALRLYFKEWSHNSHMPIVAEILRPACMYLYTNPLNFERLNKVIDAMEKAGEELANDGQVKKKTLEQISQKLGNEEEFKTLSNNFWFRKIKRGSKTY